MNRLGHSLAQAAREYKRLMERKAAGERIERRVVPGYPATHNPYLPHEPKEDCYSGCIHVRERKG